jgi:hypothetical protein
MIDHRDQTPASIPSLFLVDVHLDRLASDEYLSPLVSRFSSA